MKILICILFLPWLFSLRLCEVSEDKKIKLVSDFIKYYNLQPNKSYTAFNGHLQSVREIDNTTYSLDVAFNTEGDEIKRIVCTATVHELEEGISIVNNDFKCAEEAPQSSDEDESQESGEVQEMRMPIKLENEVQADTAISSGEQFIAIPRDQPSAPCIGCSSHVNPEAAGVQDLANMGVRHLNVHEPNVKHSLESVIEVVRQVQVVNGVRYILTLSISFNNCSDTATDSCIFLKTCKVSILVKPWQTLPSGAKYRAILANNCTEEWLFGDNGEILPEPTDGRHHNDNNSPGDIDGIKLERHEDVQSQPNQDKLLTTDGLKALEDQILPHDHVSEKDKLLPDSATLNKVGDKIESTRQYNAEYVPVTEFNQDTSGLSQDKKNAIDGILDIFNFFDFKPKIESKESRKKRSFANNSNYVGEELENVENPKYKSLAEESLKKYLHSSSSQRHYGILRLERVTVQVVSGTLTKIDFTISPTDCTINSDGSTSSSNCNFVNAEDTIKCHSAIWEQTWLKNKQYTVNCKTNVQNLHRKRQLMSLNETTSGNDITYQNVNDSKYKKQAEYFLSNRLKRQLPGGLELQNPNDPKYLTLAEESLQKYVQDKGLQGSHKVVRVDKVYTQVVAGSMTKIDFVATSVANSGLSCHSDIWEKSWENFKDIKVSCQIDNQRLKRQIPGGLKLQNPNDPKYLTLAEESLQKYVQDKGLQGSHKVVRVDKVYTQVVAGSMTKIDFVATSVANSGLSCHSDIWEKSWENFKDIKVSCQIDNQRLKRQIPGGLKLQNPNDPKYLTLAEESLQKYVQDKGLQGSHTVVRVDKVYTQVVAGTMTKIDFVATSVANSELSCHSDIWEKSWENFKDIKVSCQIDNQRLKRQIPGGLELQNPNDPKYLTLAEESLQKYVQDKGLQGSHKVVRVDKVYTQVVAGSMTKIDFVATSVANSGLSCHSDIWEKSWENFKDIKVSCQIDNQRLKRQIPGGLKLQNRNDPKYLTLAEESLQKYVQDKGLQGSHKVVRVDKVYTQVVAGSMTKIDFVATSVANSGLSCHSDIWEKSWENFKDIKVSCQIDNQRLKRQIPGGLKLQNPNDPKYLTLAEESLQKYVQDKGLQGSHTVVRVDKVYTQVVAGSMTKIDFVATSVANSGLSCHSDIWEKSWENFKDIKVSCQIDNQRLKRQIPGGLELQNPNDPKYLTLAEESLQKYVQDKGLQGSHKVVRVENVYTQVVAGSMTKIDFVATSVANSGLSCHSDIWEKSWENFKDIKVSCQIDNQRLKRQIPGGLKLQNPNDPKYLTLAEESFQKYVQEKGLQGSHTVVRVDKVYTQVVAGSMTKIDFVATSVANSGLSCHSDIWEKSWENFKDIKVSCQIDNQRLKRQIPGGLELQNPNDPKYLTLAEESLQKYVQDKGLQGSHKVVRVENVYTQVVAGSMTKIDFVATSVANSGLSCHSDIWEKSWENFKDIKVSCQIDNQRLKRQIPGGLKLQNPNDPKYLTLAEESLQKYVQDKGLQGSHKVVRVEKVYTQVVAGSMTKIDFVATSVANSGLSCHSDIWEKSWENFKDIKVSCQIDNQRLKRQIPGGLELQNPNDPKYLTLAEESLQKYVQDKGLQGSHKVVRVDKVYTQVVAGSMTKIDFVATSVANSGLSCHSDIWEKSWENFKDIKVSCQIDNQRLKRQIPGGLKLQNPNDPKYLTLAEESLQKYVQDKGLQGSHKVVRVDKVYTQVVAGSMTKIDFVATSVANSGLSCHSDIWEKSWENFKDIKVSCQIDNQRLKRQIPGGLKLQNPNDPKYLTLAEESLQKYVQDKGLQGSHKVVRVDKVYTQVVAGSMTKIDFVATSVANSGLSCHSDIWEKSWENFKDIKVFCQIDNQRLKRQIPGGLKLQNPNDPKYLTLAEESFQKYVQDKGLQGSHKVVRVDKVYTQVVAGSMTKIDFVATSVANNGLSCHSDIWEKSWENFKDIKVSCQIDNQRLKRQIPGGLELQNPNDPKYLTLAEESLQKYVQDKGLQGSHKVVRVDKVYTQVVAGTMTKIDFVATSVANSGLSCHSDIWEKSWENFKDIKVSCQIDNQRLKRQIPGGLELQNPNDPKYLTLAEESLQKYVQDKGLQGSHKVVRVDKVYTQVVAGSMTKIDFVATSVANNGLSCHSDIWEKSWENFKDIKVSCQIDNQRLKRQIPGGLKLQNPNDPKYLTLAEESLQKYVQDKGLQGSHKVVRVDKVYTQVVAGSMTKIDFVATSVANNGLSCHSDIWEKSWENFKDIKVSCQIDNQRLKRQIPGGLKLQNPNDPKYLTLAEESLQKYVQDKGLQGSHKVVRVDKVYTQVVAGTMTKIDFVATSVANNGLSCHSDIWEKSWENFKDIKVSCQIDNQRLKRQIPGGLELQNPNDPKYLTLAEESLQKYVQDKGLQGSHKVVRVEKVYTQVVAGSMTKIDFVATSVANSGLSCHSDIWEKSWENFKDIKVSCQIDNQRLKRQIPGGLKLQNPNDPKYLTLAEESLQKYVQDKGLQGSHKVVRVEKVYTQVVAGSMTKIDFVATSVANSGLSCHSDIWEKSWENFKDIKVSCQIDNQRLKRQIPGGLELQNPNDPKYLTLAEESLQKYVQDKGLQGSHKVVRVDKVYTQVVAGSMTKIDFVATSVANNGLSCHSDIWEKSWENFKDIKVSCQIDNQRLKRQIPGGLKLQNPNDPKYLTLAEESLQKYVQDKGLQGSHKVVRVDKVYTQVVAGTMTKIDFVATSVANNGLSCHSDIWEKSWENFKDIKVSCQIDNQRLKRQIPGGLELQNPNDPKYLTLAEESLQKYVQDKGLQGSHKVVRVEKVYTQVVAGSMTKIDFVATSVANSGLSCHSDIWEKSWENFKDIKVSCQIDNQRLKRQIPGGLKLQNPNDPKYLTLAEESLQKYVQDKGLQGSHKVVRVDKVYTQVVAGSMTKIDFVATSVANSGLSCHSDIWEKSWENFKDIKVSCQIDNQRLKRQIPGGLELQNPNDPKYLTLAEESLQKYVQDKGLQGSHKVVRVDKVYTQVVAGSMTKIDFVATSVANNGLSCHSDIWEKSWENFKDIKVSCQIDNQRLKRQIPGGLELQNPNDPKYLTLAEESLQKYVQDKGLQGSHKVVRVDKVYTQVVAGSMTKIDFVATSVANNGLSCHSDIWEKSWENFKDIKVSCQIDNQRLKRQIPGGLKLQNPNDPKYLTLAEESLQKYVQDKGLQGSHKVVRVDKVYTQVVAGTMTKIDFVAISVANNGLSCHSDIWEKSWENFKDIKVSCQIDNQRLKRQIPGGLELQNPNDPKYLTLAQESLQKYLTDTRNQRRHEVARIVSVSTKISNGALTKIDFLVTPVKNPNADVFDCMSNIWIKSTQNKTDINVFCAINYVKLKDLHNCEIKNKDPTNPNYLRMAQDSLEQFLHDNGHSKLHKVIQVTNVTIETCYDTMTRIYFLAAPADNLEDTFKCFSSIWKHFWLSEKERNVSCQIDVLKRHVQVPHTFTEENPTEGKYLMAAEKSLDKYITNAGNNQSHKVVRIERVLANRMFTKIDFEAVLTDNLSIIMNCTAKIFKRILVDSQVTCVSNELKSRQKRELLLENKMNKPQTKKNYQKEEDVTKPEYKLLAAQALRKFSKRTGILYKLNEVVHVTKQVVAGLTYNIKFSASPTECLSEVSNVAALSCKAIRNITVDCNAHIWDKPWIRKIKINIRCSTADDISNQDYADEDTNRENANAVEAKLSFQDIQGPKVRALAEEALEKYLSLSNKTYFYKITKILTYNVRQQNGIVRNIMFSISPTVCLRHVYIDSIENCKFKKPRSYYKCVANIHEKSWLTVQKDIEITCKKLSDNKSKFAIRLKRQMIEKDNEDGDTISYYADRVLQEVNKRSDGNDLFKMVSIHAIHRNIQNQSPAVKLVIEIARDLEHKLCQAKIYPSPSDKFNIKHVSVVCDGNDIEMFLNMTMKQLEKDPDLHFKIVRHGKAEIISKASDGSNEPIKIYFAIALTNCTKNTSVPSHATNCLANVLMPLKYCRSLICIDNELRTVKNINASCDGSFSKESENDTDYDFESKTIPRKYYNNIDDQEIAKPLTKQALRVIEAKYPQPNKQKIARILSFKEIVTNSHYRMRIEVSLTNCTALSEQNVCEIINGTGRVCRVDVWLDKLSDRSPLSRVYCEVDKESATENANAPLSLFIKFLDTYNRTYIDNDTEWQYRFQIFKDNIREIHNLNVFEKATATYGITRFTDLTSEEFNLKYTGLNMDLRDDKHRSMKDAEIPNIKIPSSYDWREFDAVTEVKDQGSCGNSWAFSVTGNIESQIKIKTKKLLSLSEQHLMNCDQFNKGCDGGLPENAYRTITEKGAAECLLDGLEKVEIIGGLDITSNETDMAKWITVNGPISIGVNSAPLQFYMSGVIHLSSFYCNNAKLNHNALIVGYGEEEHPIYKKKVPYWVIKNSWGKNWGEEGYYRMYRGNGTCGVNKMATSALVTTLSV